MFRDCLRTRPGAAAAYAALKTRLAVEFAGDVDGYTRAKGAFVEDLIGGEGASRYSAAARGA